MTFRSYKYALLGESGSGKTHSAATLALCPGIEKVCYLFTEPGEATFESGTFPQKLKDMLGTKIHSHRVKIAGIPFDEMADNMEKMVGMTRKALLEQPFMGSDTVRLGFNRVLRGLNKYTCDITGENFGPVDDWPASWALVFDSLSGLNLAIRRQVVGSKPALHQGDWGIGMNIEEEMVEKLTLGLDCTVVLLAHLCRERDEVLNTTTVTIDALGSKLGPKLPRNFSEVILCEDRGKEGYWWSTSKRNHTLKHRRLKKSDKLPPTFEQIYQEN